MSQRVASLLNELDRLKSDYGDEARRRKMTLLQSLARRRLARAADVLRLHEALCFLRAYPDDAELLERVEAMLSDFATRGDLRRHCAALVNSGIAGTEIRFQFYEATAQWLAKRCGSSLAIDWDAFEQRDKLEELLPRLALYCETPGLDEFAFDVREWIDRMKGTNETDAEFFLRRLEQLRLSSFARESLFESLDLPLVLAPGPKTPCRTREFHRCGPTAFQSGPLMRKRPSVSTEVARPPKAIRAASAREGGQLVDLARSAMATRSRDLDAFAYGDPRDVRLADCGDGLVFALIGVAPERRFLLETLYGFLMLKNGVPVGYGTYTGLFGSAEVAYTVFDTFRSGEAAAMYGRVLAIGRHVFGLDVFMVDPYQLGHENDDAIASGAWWFYQKLGFRPREAALLQVMRREQRRMKTNRKHRSSAATLRKLSACNVYLHLGRARDDVVGLLPLGNIGLCITAYLAKRFGHDRRLAEATCARQAASLLGLRSLRALSAGERLAWNRWGPLILVLPRLDRWPREDRQALASIVRAKGGRRESEYLARFDQHRRLRKAIATLARSKTA